jgi:hypothetical protein
MSGKTIIKVKAIRKLVRQIEFPDGKKIRISPAFLKKFDELTRKHLDDAVQRMKISERRTLMEQDA